jgi:hypothetical protein
VIAWRGNRAITSNPSTGTGGKDKMIKFGEDLYTDHLFGRWTPTATPVLGDLPTGGYDARRSMSASADLILALAEFPTTPSAQRSRGWRPDLLHTRPPGGAGREPRPAPGAR